MIFKRVLLLVLCGSPLAFCCQPVRLGVQIDNLQTFRKDAALVIHIKTKDATGQVCNATRAYQVRLTVTAPSGVLFNAGNVSIPAGRSDPSAPYDTVRVSLKRGNRLVTGQISINATAQGLLSGAATITFSAHAAPATRQPMILLAAFDPAAIIQRVQEPPAPASAHRIGLSLICEDAGQVPANGKDAAVLTVILDSPAPRNVTLYFPNSPSDWDGKIAIPAGKTEMTAPVYIRSHATGDLTIDKLRKAGDESAFRLDAGSSCKISFVPPQYAFLALDTTRVILGGSVTVCVTLLDANKTPFSGSDQMMGAVIPLHLNRGRGTFTAVGGKPGIYMFTPVAFGSAAIVFQDVERGLIHTLTGDPSNPLIAPAVLQVEFPMTWLFWSIVISLGAALLHFQLLGQKQKVAIRCGVGVSAGVLLMLALTQPLFPVSHWISSNTISVCIVAFVGGWGGSSVINALSKTVLPGSSDAPDLPSAAGKTA